MSAPNILILGGVGGIGEALAHRMAATGAHVTVTSRTLDKAQGVASTIHGGACAVDVLDEASINAAVETAAQGGTLAGLAYCVGSIPLKPLSRTGADDMVEVYRLHVVGAMLAVRAAAGALKAGNGSVVFYSSIAARQGFPNHAAVASAKGAIEALTLSLAAELAPHARVNAIAPSLTQTPLAGPLTANPKMAEGIAALHPLPRLGTSDEMAALSAFLLSKDAGWITGQIIGVDGGRSSLRVGKA